MPKGKKFDAAEAHFKKKEDALGREIKRLNDECRKYRKEVNQKNERILELEDENRSLNEWVERLLSFTEMSREDIVKLCEDEKKKADSLHLIGSVMKSVGVFF